MKNTDLNKNAAGLNNLEKKSTPSPTTKSSVTDKVGDAIEKAGDFLSEKVSRKAGDVIHKLGDKIEHARD